MSRPPFGKHRLVINYRQANLSDNPVFLICNCLFWHAPGITRIYRHRWPVEVYHEEGKDEGLDQYQLRDFEAIERHIALVAVVYSLLRAAQHDPALRDKLQRELKLELEGSAAFWRRATQAQSLWCLALFISAGLTQGQNVAADHGAALARRLSRLREPIGQRLLPGFPLVSAGEMGAARRWSTDAVSAHIGCLVISF